MIELTKEEAIALANHLDYYLLQEVRDDPDYDNLDYFATLAIIYKRCKTAVKEEY